MEIIQDKDLYLLKCRIYTSSLLYGKKAYDEYLSIKQTLINFKIMYSETKTSEKQLPGGKGREHHRIFKLDNDNFIHYQLIR